MWSAQMSRIKVPQELRPAPPQLLEDYVRARLTQFLALLSQRLGQYVPALSREAFDHSAAEVLRYLPAGDHGNLTLEEKQLQLVFRHDCLALGCLDPQCVLCQHNPSRRCTVNFDRKYLVNDPLKARCGAVIRVELIDPATGMPLDEKLPELTLQMCVLDGNLYDTKFLESGKVYEGGLEPPEELEACALLYNKKKSTPLLVCNGSGTNDPAGFVLLNTVDGKVQLDLHVTDSSEAILSGRKPPFRLLVRVLPQPHTARLKIRHAVSEGFVVATRRTRTAGKADIPSVEDPIGKLDHMGKETIKKLMDLNEAARQAGVEIDIPENCVQRVGDFKKLALRADQDGHLRQKLQHVLKLSKEKWDEARDHAMRAVVADSRMRAWYADRRTCELGIVFTARLGNVDLERPLGLLQGKLEAGERKTEVTLMAQLTPAQRESLRHLHPQAVAAWWMQGHPGWAIFQTDTELFLPSQTGGGTGTNTPSLDAPSSPTSSVMSLGGTSGVRERRNTNGGGTDVSLQLGEAPFLGAKQLQAPHQSMPAALPSYGAGGSIVAPQAQMGSFGLPAGSNRSSRSNSVTDSPPPMNQQTTLPLQFNQSAPTKLPSGHPSFMDPASMMPPPPPRPFPMQTAALRGTAGSFQQQMHSHRGSFQPQQPYAELGQQQLQQQQEQGLYQHPQQGQQPSFGAQPDETALHRGSLPPSQLHMGRQLSMLPEGSVGSQSAWNYNRSLSAGQAPPGAFGQRGTILQPGAHQAIDPHDDLPTRGSANPRPTKMMSIGNRGSDGEAHAAAAAAAAAAASPAGTGGTPPHPQALPPSFAAGPQADPSGPPPNPFLRVQSERLHSDDDDDDSDAEDDGRLASVYQQMAGPNAFSHGAGSAAAGPGQAQAAGQQAGAGAGQNGSGGAGAGAGLAVPAGLPPTLSQMDSKVFFGDMSDEDFNMLLGDAPSLTNAPSYGLFMPAGLADALPGTLSRELLQPRTSGLDTMASIEHALPGISRGGGAGAAGPPAGPYAR